MGVLYSVAALDATTRPWFTATPLPDGFPDTSSLPFDAQLEAMATSIPAGARGARPATRMWRRPKDDERGLAGSIGQVALERGEENTLLNVFTKNGRRHVYFEKGWPTLVYDAVAALSSSCGPLVLAPDNLARPFLVPPVSFDSTSLARAGFVTLDDVYGEKDNPYSRPGSLLLPGNYPAVPKELVKKAGVVRAPGFVYVLDAGGDVARVAIGGVRGGAPEVVLRLGIVREQGWSYFLDEAGDVVRVRSEP